LCATGFALQGVANTVSTAFQLASAHQLWLKRKPLLAASSAEEGEARMSSHACSAELWGSFVNECMKQSWWKPSHSRAVFLVESGSIDDGRACSFKFS
jgi:hypothetical protein